jgi:hypothetical protein
MDLRGRCGVLKGHDILPARHNYVVDAPGFSVKRSEVFHNAFLSANCSRKPGFSAFTVP